MKKTSLLLSVLATISLASCTTNERVKYYGATTTLNLPSGQKLVNITWKEENIWYLTKPMTSTDVAETYTFNEESNNGLIEGTVIIKESK